VAKNSGWQNSLRNISIWKMSTCISIYHLDEAKLYLTLHVSSRRVHCISVLGVHVSSAYSLLGIPSRLASGLTWRSVARRSVARRTVAPAFGLPGVRSPWRSAPWRSVAAPHFRPSHKVPPIKKCYLLKVLSKETSLISLNFTHT